MVGIINKFLANLVARHQRDTILVIWVAMYRRATELTSLVDPVPVDMVHTVLANLVARQQSTRLGTYLHGRLVARRQALGTYLVCQALRS